MLEQGVIRSSTSPCGSLVHLVPKKDATWRMCVNDRALDKMTLKYWCSLAMINDFNYSCEVLTKLDLKYGYQHVCIKEEDT